jgi:hypothetical protein
MRLWRGDAGTSAMTPARNAEVQADAHACCNAEAHAGPSLHPADFNAENYAFLNVTMACSSAASQS